MLKRATPSFRPTRREEAPDFPKQEIRQMHPLMQDAWGAVHGVLYVVFTVGWIVVGKFLDDPKKRRKK